MVLKFENLEIANTDNVAYTDPSGVVHQVDTLQLDGVTVWTRYVFPVGGILLERDYESTYSVQVPVSGTYEVICVGGGGGAGYIGVKPGSLCWGGIGSGGSGGYCACNIELSAGDLVAGSVGKLGDDAGVLALLGGRYNKTGETGGTTTFTVNGVDKLTSRGGTGGHAEVVVTSDSTQTTISNGATSKGTGGTCTSNHIRTTAFYSGNDGNNEGDVVNLNNTGSKTFTAAGGASRYSPYGAGTGGGVTISPYLPTYSQSVGAAGYIRIKRIA